MLSRHSIIAALTAVTVVSLGGAAHSEDVDWKAVGKALGKEGTLQAGNVYRVGLPRSDLKVTLDGVGLKPGFALGGWLGFESMGAKAMVMGDLVLLESEVNPVMQKLQHSGIEITAIHNHLLRSSPTTIYMHVMGQGDPVKLAQELHDGLSLSKTPLAASAAAAPPDSIDLDVAAVDKIIGTEGKVNGGVLQYGIPRAEEITDMGMVVPPAMGSAIAINFQPTDAGKAAITGDFVLVGAEISPVLKSLRDNGVEVTALHSHMIEEQPRLYFMHFWANDDAQKLAQALKAALSRVNIKKKS